MSGTALAETVKRPIFQQFKPGNLISHFPLKT